MATVTLGSVVADIRGSIGQEVYARNRAGIFVRARTSPSQPSSSERDLRQAAITAISQYWSGTLTEAQRSQWRQYAATYPLPDRFGRTKFTTGANFFLRNNVQRYRIASAVTRYTPPALAPTWAPTFTFTADASLNQFDIALPPANYDPPPGTFRLYAYAGRVINVGRDFYAGPWRYIGYNQYVGPPWFSDPWTPTYPWTLSAGDKVFCRLVAALSDGNTSPANQTSTIIVP